MFRQRKVIWRDYLAHAPLALAFERLAECVLLSEVKMTPPILDIGCGDGLFASILFQEPLETGVDPDTEELDRAGKRAVYKELLACDGANIPKPDGSYNTIFSNSVLEHIPEIAPVFKEAFRLLRPGGRFYFTVPTQDFERYTVVGAALEALGATSLLKKFTVRYNQFWKHYHAYPTEKWKQFGEAAGFVCVGSTRYNSKSACICNDGLVPLAILSFVWRRIFGRWVLSPRLRKVVVSGISRNFSPRRTKPQDPAGGLVFMLMEKPEAKKG